MARKVVIIGSGPAAHTAAIYAARANLQPLLFEGFMAGGLAAGGQLTTTTDVENYPGFPEPISGPELCERFRAQSLRYGTEILTETVTSVDLRQRPLTVMSDQTTVETEALIIATGATAQRMGVPGEEQFWQKGISACAVCDGALPIFRNKVLAVIGGGDSAVEEATHLTKFASKVLLIHRRDTLRASKIMQERALKHPKIEVVWNTVLTRALGHDALTGIEVEHVATKAKRTIACGGLFYAIGNVPNTAFLNGQLKLDNAGYITTVPGSTRTSVEGVFAAGDVQDRVFRQAVTAAGTGCMAAIEAEHWLESHASPMNAKPDGAK